MSRKIHDKELKGLERREKSVFAYLKKEVEKESRGRWKGGREEGGGDAEEFMGL